MKWPRPRLRQLLLDARSGTWGSPPDESKPVYPVLRSTNIQDGKLVVDNPALRTLSENTVEKYHERRHTRNNFVGKLTPSRKERDYREPSWKQR